MSLLRVHSVARGRRKRTAPSPMGCCSASLTFEFEQAIAQGKLISVTRGGADNVIHASIMFEASAKVLVVQASFVLRTWYSIGFARATQDGKGQRPQIISTSGLSC